MLEIYMWRWKLFNFYIRSKYAWRTTFNIATTHISQEMLCDDFVTTQKQFANEGHSHLKVNVINLENFSKINQCCNLAFMNLLKTTQLISKYFFTKPIALGNSKIKRKCTNIFSLITKAIDNNNLKWWLRWWIQCYVNKNWIVAMKCKNAPSMTIFNTLSIKTRKYTRWIKTWWTFFCIWTWPSATLSFMMIVDASTITFWINFFKGKKMNSIMDIN